MAKRGADGPTLKAADLSPEQMRQAIPILEKRIAELKSVPLNAVVPDGDNLLKGIENKIADTLLRVFGADTIEAERYRVVRLSSYAMVVYSGQDTSWYARLPKIKEAVARAISSLSSCVEILSERIEGVAIAGDVGAIKAYAGLDLHPEIARAASQLYKDGHYANAVEAAVKRLNGLVRLRSDLEQDGSTLMERAFNPTNPVLAFNDIANQSDKDEQKGFMMLFSGAVAGLRNPRAHGFVKDDPERALEFIAFVSLLAKLLDEATERRS